MLVTILAWIIITWICWSWGALLLRVLKHSINESSFIIPSFSITCMTGFAVVTVIGGVLSLWMPLGEWPALLIVVIPCFLPFFQKTEAKFLEQIRKLLVGLRPAYLLLLGASVLTVLIMSTWRINHPDTLAYHAQTIHWIENFRIIPGLVHLYIRYGYQGQWFVACALFSFRFTGTDALTFINSTVVVWYLLFVVGKINQYSLEPGSRIKAILGLLLLVASCVSYTQVRLTATSASPDFIAALLLWLVFYLFLRKETRSSQVLGILVTFLAVFSLTIKLSALPVAILAVFSVLRLLWLKKIKAFVISCLLSVLVIVPFVARNIITTGWLVFPSAYPDIVNVDWKFDRDRTILEKEYITAYARTHVDYVKEDIEAAVKLSPGKWIRQWWHNMDGADKAILIMMALTMLATLARFNSIRRSSAPLKAALLTSTVGLVFWFIEAPDPRFGFGFIMSFTGILLYLIFVNTRVSAIIQQRMISLLILSVSMAIILYGGYRLVNYFIPHQLLTPLGITNGNAVSIECGNQSFNRPADAGSCGDLPLPCIYSDTCNFRLRGDHLSDGFKAKADQYR